MAKDLDLGAWAEPQYIQVKLSSVFCPLELINKEI